MALTLPTLSIAKHFSIRPEAAKLGMTYFGIIQSAFLAAYGAVELNERVKEEPKSTLRETISHLWAGIFGKRADGRPDYVLMHGTLFLGSGIFGTAAALHQLNHLELGEWKTKFFFLADWLFISANVVAIKHNVELYQNSTDPDVLRSAVLGIISSFNYILAGIIPIIGLPTALAFVFGGIAVSTGGLKIVYDFFSS